MEMRPHPQALTTSSYLCFHGLKPYGKHIFLTKNQEMLPDRFLCHFPGESGRLRSTCGCQNIGVTGTFQQFMGTEG